MTIASRLRAAAPEVGTVSALTLLVVLPVWPGIFTVDSQSMLEMARQGTVDDWYSPVLVTLWGFADNLGFPPSGVLVVATVVFIAALLALYRLGLPRHWALVATSLTVVFPPVFGLLGWVGRDVWFVGLVLVSMASLGWASTRPQRRPALIALALVAAWFASDARQNGFPVLVVTVVASAVLVVGPRRRRWLVVVGTSTAAVVAGLALHRVAESVVVQRDVAPELSLYYGDLLEVSFRLDESLVPRQLLPPSELDEVRRAWVPGQVGAVLFRDHPLVPFPRFSSPPWLGDLRGAWFDMILDHPAEYAVVRGDLYRRQLGIGGHTVPGAWYAVSDELDWEGSPGLQQRFANLNDARRTYLEAFDADAPGSGGPLHRAWIYLLLGLAGSLAIVMHHRRLRLLGWSTLALQVLMQAVLFFAAPLVEFRFELFQVTLGIALAVIGTWVWYNARRSIAVPPEAETTSFS